MLRISDESYERVQSIIEDMSYCCEFEDDYDQWEDIAASSMASFLDDLDGAVGNVDRVDVINPLCRGCAAQGHVPLRCA